VRRRLGDADQRPRRHRRRSRFTKKRDLAEKGWVPLRYWIIWWAALAVADLAFYVVLTPIWLGLRAAGWIAARRAYPRDR
jgi:hypothetical protein